MLKIKKKEEQKDNENIDNTNTQQSKLKTIKSIKSTNSNIKKNNSGGYTTLKNNTKKSDTNCENIIKYMNKINKDMLND